MGFGLYAVDYEAMFEEIGQESAIRLMDLSDHIDIEYVPGY